VAHVSGIHTCRYPTLTEVEVQVLKGYAGNVRIPIGASSQGLLATPTVIVPRT
jgi:hypothetical protein